MASPENFVSVSRRPPDVEDYIDILRRYRSWILGPAFAGLVAAVVVAFMWPDSYVSTAVMRITPQQVPQTLVPSAINSQMAERLTQMQTEILSRTSLSEMILRPSLNLYSKVRQRMPADDVVELMRKDIRISLLDTGSSNPNRMAEAFAIQYRYTDKYKAQAVVREIVSKFSEQNVRVLTDESNSASLNDIAAQVSNRNLSETLEVLDTASLPEQPSEPNRLAIAGAGSAAGLILGIVLAGVKEMRNTSLKNLKDVRAYTNLPVLTSIPLLEKEFLLRRKRRLFWLAWSAAIILGTALMSGSIFCYFSSRA